MTRAASWSNPDNLIVGFGQNIPERLVAGAVKKLGQDKELRLQITKDSTFGAAGAKITVPANCLVKNVYMKVGTAWVGGTSLAFGDGGSTGGWITAAQGAEASLTVGVAIQAQGAYAYTASEGQLPPKVYAAATDLYVTSVGTHTAGDATIVVELA